MTLGQSTGTFLSVRFSWVYLGFNQMNKEACLSIFFFTYILSSGTLGTYSKISLAEIPMDFTYCPEPPYSYKGYKSLLKNEEGKESGQQNLNSP